MAAYEYYVVEKGTGRVIFGADYKSDANDHMKEVKAEGFQGDWAILTAATVRQRYGRITWMTNSAFDARRR